MRVLGPPRTGERARAEPAPLRRATPRFAWDLAPYTGHFAALDGLRGLAILLVFFYHCFIYVPWRAPFTAGWCGIELFFVLSGFLITGLLVDSREEPHALRNFYVRRALRIVPLYYAVLAGLYLSIWIGGGPKAGRILSEQLYFWGHVQNLFMGYTGWYDPLFFTHFWSLGVEVQFYLLWPLVLLRLDARGALLASGAGVLLSFALRNALPVSFPFSYVSTFTHLEGVMVGSGLALLLRTKRQLLGRCAPAVLVLGGVGLVLLDLWRGGLHVSDPWVVRLSYLLFALFFGALLASLFDRGRFGRAVCGVFERPWLGFLGKYSYGIFLTHWIVHLKLKKPLLEALQEATGSELAANLLAFLVQVVVTFALSIASYHLLEERCLRLKNALAPHARGRLAQVPVPEVRKTA